MLNIGDPDLDKGLGGASFIGEELFCLNSRLRCECPFLIYNFGRPGGLHFSTEGTFSLIVEVAVFLFLFSAWSFFVGIVSIGGGSGLTVGSMFDVGNTSVGKGSENGDLMFFGKGAKPLT